MKENEIPIIINENKEEYRNLLQDIYAQLRGEKGNLVVSIEGVQLKFSKDVDVLYNFFEININDKKIINELYANLKGKTLEDPEKFLNLSMDINNYIENLIYDEEYALVLKKNIEIIDIFKGVSLGIEDEEKNLIDQLLSYINISENLLGTKLFFLLILKSFFRMKNYLAFIILSCYQKLNL